MTQGREDEQDWEAVVPYAGPPSYQDADRPPVYPPPRSWGPPAHGAPPGYGVPPGYAAPPAYGAPGAPPAYGAPPFYGAAPGWAWAPPRPAGPTQPGTTVAAAVLAFVLALLTLFGTVYAMFFSALLAVSRSPAGGLGPWIALVQLAVVGALVVGGVYVLGSRRTWLLAAAAATIALSVYWAVVLSQPSLPGLGEDLLAVPLVFAVLAALTAGLACTPAARAWERHRRAGRAAAGG